MVSKEREERVAEDWFYRSFDALYPVIYAHRTVEAAEPEVAFAIRQLKLKQQDHVLDLACGAGRHMVHLLRHTARVVGLDYSAASLKSARECLGGAGRLVRADMRSIPFGRVLDVVVNFFTSFGYFVRAEENLAVVREVARVLKPGGQFFIDYLNAAFVEKTLVPVSTRQREGYTIRERRWIDRGRVNKVTEVSRDGAAVGRWEESVQLYNEEGFRELLRQGGLIAESVFGDYKGSPLGEDRPRMIVVGHNGA